MCLGSPRSLGSLGCLGSLGSLRSPGSLGVSGVSGVPGVSQALRVKDWSVVGGSQSIGNAQGIWEQPPSDVTGSASDCLGITPLGGFRLNRWDPKFPNLKHHGVCCQTVCLDSLEPWRGPLQRRSFSEANCSYQAVLPSRPRQVSCSKPLGWSRGLGALLATEPLVGCQQDQILGLGLRQTVRDRTTGRTSFVKPTGSSNFFASSKLEALRCCTLEAYLSKKRFTQSPCATRRGVESS